MLPKQRNQSTVAATRNTSYSRPSCETAVRQLLDNLEPSLTQIVKPGTRVLVKVNMGCSGVRDPANRLTTHPAVAEAIILALLDCGATVCFGDDVARAGKHCESIYKKTGMLEVANRTGTKLIDFVAVGAREVRSHFLYPKSYLVTNAYFEADVVINAANCRSHIGIGMSGAMKNMFGCLIGLRKQAIHNHFPGEPEKFGRTLADVYRTIPADLSFLDLTTVAEAAGITLDVRPVGLMLAGFDAVALDTVAAHAIGYERLSIWIAHYGKKFGIGCGDIDRINIRGLDWNTFNKARLRYPLASHAKKPSALDQVTTVLNNTVLRPRPVINELRCSGCGDCAGRCPVSSIYPVPNGAYRINLSDCVDCGCCLKTCELSAINTEFTGLAKTIRRAIGRLPKEGDHKPPNLLDPAPKSSEKPVGAAASEIVCP